MNVLFLIDLACGDIRINHMNGDILIILVMTRVHLYRDALIQSIVPHPYLQPTSQF